MKLPISMHLTIVMDQWNYADKMNVLFHNKYKWLEINLQFMPMLFFK